MNCGAPETSSCGEDGLPSRDCITPARCAFFLDLDGTLLEIAHRPAAVRVASDLPVLIADLYTAATGALALISGRPIADIDRLLRMPHLPVAGQHGAERRDACGRIHVHPVDNRALSALRMQIPAWCAAHPGLVIEDKGLSLALHYRGSPGLEQALNDLSREAIGNMNGEFLIQPGKMVFEIKPSGRDKGRAIEEFLSEAPFSGRLPVFIGDDAADEYGFAAVNARGGVSIKVGDGATAAQLRLQSVDAVHRWLRNVLATGNRSAQS